jgi:tetratricopeptide (TPR) repeat protein
MPDVQSLIDQLWDFTNASASEVRFLEAIRSTHDPAHALELQTQVARARGLCEAYTDGHCTLDAAESALAELGDDARFAPARVRCLLERGRLFNSSNQRAKAVPLFEQAFNSARRINNDHLAIDAAHMIAIVHDLDGRAAEAMEWNGRALRMAEQSSQPRARQWRGSLHNNIGWTLHARGDFATALTHFEDALRCRREQGEMRDTRIAIWCVARCLRSLGRCREALLMQQSLADEIHQAGAKEDGFILEELGECFLALDRRQEAAAHFLRALEVLSQDEPFAQREAARLARLSSLARRHTGC